MNFNIELDIDNAHAIVVAPGIPSFFDNLIKKGAFRNTSIYTDLSGRSVVCTVAKKNWSSCFDYDEYKTLAFREMSFYSSVSDLLALYIELLTKSDRDETESLHFASLRDSLKRIKNRDGIKFDKIIEDCLKDDSMELFKNVASFAGRFVGGIISELNPS